MFHLSRENNQTKENLYSNIFFRWKMFCRSFLVFFIFTLQITIITADTAVTG